MPDTPNNSETFILCEVLGTSYGIRTSAVRQMEMIEQITPVPNAPPFVEGVVYSRGQVIPALNMRVKFGFEKIPYDVRSRLIVININNRTVGLIVDKAREFISIPINSIKPPPDAISGLSEQYLEGIVTLGERLILILNIAEIINIEEETIISYKENG
ncbi:MAG: chemotaxis protein CheW [Aphanothece sp. CMT-3BRIN-NPC111]|jgi:purine-binding chemotaxis protein CheW|nr:chemotaxis protein CheW [Aphanothece sp. CMT-3BRIN-NPC111]